MKLLFQFQEAEIYNVSDRLKKDNTFYSSQRSKALRSVTKSLLFQLNNGIVSCTSSYLFVGFSCLM